MTDPTAPTAEDVIRDVLLDYGASPGGSLHSWRCEHPDRYGPCTCVAEVVAAVVAAIRAMDAETLADLIGGYVEKALATATWRDGHAIPATRVVGPWQETP